MCSIETRTGAPISWFEVKTAAARAGVGEWISARSFLPLGLMPAATPPARIPGTAVIPPSSQSTSAILGVHRRGLEPRALAPAEEDAEALHAVGRAALAEVVDGRHAGRPTGARVRDERHVAVVGADDVPRRRPRAVAEHAHE